MKGSFLERSKEKFAGALSFQGTHGAFGMVPRENDHPNFDENFTARKWVFSFDDRIICLGSNIRNNTLAYPTETVLFQGYLQTESAPIWANSSTSLTSFPYSEEIAQTTDSWLLDAYGTGYYVPGSQTIKISRSLQSSKHKDTRKYNEGNYSAAWLDHGTAPRGSSYEYAILLDTDAAGIQNFHSQMQNPATELYQVYQQDSLAHIIKDNQTGIFAYSLFEPNTSITHGDLRSNTHPALVMIKNEGTGLILSMVNPDLNLPNDLGKGTPDASVLVKVTLTIAGEWEASGTAVKYAIVSNSGNTVIEFDCVEGLEVEANLVTKGSTAKSSPLTVTLDNNTVEEDSPRGELIGELGVNSELEIEKFVLVDNEDFDNDYFEIIDYRLVTKKTLTLFKRKQYKIKVRAEAKPLKGQKSGTYGQETFIIEVSGTQGIGIEESPDEVMRVYPNPVLSELNASFEGSTKTQVHATIFNLAGTQVAQFEFSKSLNAIQMNLSELPPGLYILHVNDGKKKMSKKIIKQ